MGILNVTPDSFSDGGRFLAPEAAVDHGLRMVADGADVGVEIVAAADAKSPFDATPGHIGRVAHAVLEAVDHRDLDRRYIGGK